MMAIYRGKSYGISSSHFFSTGHGLSSTKTVRFGVDQDVLVFLVTRICSGNKRR